MKSISRRNFINLAISGAAFPVIKKIAYPVSSVKPAYANPNEVDSIAEDYVKLALQVSQHDPNYIDTYFGPEEWKQDLKVPLPQIPGYAGKLLDRLLRVPKTGLTQLEHERIQFLEMHISAVKSKAELLGGRKMSFDEEFFAIYGKKAERLDESSFLEIIEKVEKMVPGNGGILERIQKIKSGLIVHEDKMEMVFSSVIDEARRRTIKYIKLPPGENVIVKYVKDTPFNASCRYQGNNTSLVEINTSLQIDLFWLIYLVCHEVYPGHHTYFNLIDQRFKKENKWTEFSIIPICSPMELMLEGTAVYNIDLAFPLNERIDFGINIAELAGLDPSGIELYANVSQHLGKLKNMAFGQIAQEYLEGLINRDAAIKKFMKYAIVNEQEAELTVRRFETDERSYLKTYYTGRLLITDYVKRNSSAENQIEQQWNTYNKLLTQIPTSTIWK